jgi:hypothetical protein
LLAGRMDSVVDGYSLVVMANYGVLEREGRWGKGRPSSLRVKSLNGTSIEKFLIHLRYYLTSYRAVHLEWQRMGRNSYDPKPEPLRLRKM